MWADVETVTVGYLSEHLAGIPVSTSVPRDETAPEKRPARFVRVQSGGSRRRTLVHRDTRVTLECWSEAGEADASALAELVYAVLDDWDLVPDFDGWQGGPYPQPDPETGTPRYVMTVILRHRIGD